MYSEVDPCMAYRGEVLPFSDWPTLESADLPLTHLPPAGSLIVVTKDLDLPRSPIVGRWMAYSVVMLEGLWLAASHRGRPGVARRLLHKMLQELRDRNVQAAITISQSPEIDAMAERAGFVRVPGTIWQKDLREGR